MGNFPFGNLLLNPLMWSHSIEIRDIGTQDTMQLLLMDDQEMIQALSSHTPQEAFTDRIGSRRVIGRFEHLDATRCCDSSETKPELAIIIANKVLWRLSIRSRFPKLLCGPGVGRTSGHAHMNDFPRSHFDDEKGEKRAEEQISDL